MLTLISFIAQVRNGEAQQVTGIYIQDILALPVIQQPKNSPAYVSTASDVATQFGMASQFDTLGFLAHNYLAGEAFFDVIVDDILYVIYGDGHYERFQVDQIRRFQALQPASVYSDFLDLATKTKFSASDLFYETYGTGDRLILQTCIAVGKQDSWGRLFVIAVPYTPPGASNYPSLIQLQK